VGCRREETGSPGPQEPTVSVAQPVTRQVTEYASFTGQIQPVDSVELRARVTGYLQKICYEPGSFVKENDVLFEIDPTPYQIQVDQAAANLAVAQSQAAESTSKVNQAAAQADLDRAKHAMDEEVAKTPGAISAKKLDESAAAVKESEAALEFSKTEVVAEEAAVKVANAQLESAKLNLEWTKVKAPISGRVDRSLLTVGNMVTMDNTVLTNIVATDEVYGYFNVDEMTFLEVKKKISAGALSKMPNVPVSIGLENEEGYPHQGTVDLVANALGSGTGTMQIRAIFKNSDGALTPGNFFRIRLPIDQPRDRLLVADRSIISDQGEQFVLIVNKDDKIEKRKVDAGWLDPQDKSMRVIDKGIAGDDWIVVQGRQRVRPDMHVKAEHVETPQTSEADMTPKT
jgi:RND family efflux transporter MFP subunit